MKSILLIAALFIMTASFAQNPFFGHLYKPSQPNEPIRARTIIVNAGGDTVFTGFRPTATAAYGYSKDGGSTVLAFAGIAWEHDTYKKNSDHWNTDYAISLQLGTGASNGSVSLANATTAAIFASFFNKLLTVGFGYNFSNKNGIPLVGPGIAFH